MSKFEEAVLRFILETEAPDLLCHLSYIYMSSREYTGVGVYINFLYQTMPISRFQVNKSTLGSDVYASINEDSVDVGVALYIDDGLISMLEIFCHGNFDFPVSIRDYNLERLQ